MLSCMAKNIDKILTEIREKKLEELKSKQLISEQPKSEFPQITASFMDLFLTLLYHN